MLLFFRDLLFTGAIISLITYIVCRREPYLQSRISAMLLLSICALIVFILTGITPRSGFHPSISPDSVQLIPFKGIRTVLYYGITVYAVENILGNIVMMMPIGFLLPLFFEKLRKWYKVGLIGIALSVLIECSQLFLSRGTDIDDVLLNLMGTLTGYIIWRIFWRKPIRMFEFAVSDKGWNVLWLCALLIPYMTEIVLGFADLLIQRM